VTHAAGEVENSTAAELREQRDDWNRRMEAGISETVIKILLKKVCLGVAKGITKSNIAATQRIAVSRAASVPDGRPKPSWGQALNCAENRTARRSRRAGETPRERAGRVALLDASGRAFEIHALTGGSLSQDDDSLDDRIFGTRAGEDAIANLVCNRLQPIENRKATATPRATQVGQQAATSIARFLDGGNFRVRNCHFPGAKAAAGVNAAGTVFPANS
jgi:hypothetical protein